MGNDLFRRPDRDHDKTYLEGEERPGQRSEYFKPAPRSEKKENRIRLLPARADFKAGITYYIAAGVHFVAVDDEDRKAEKFTCMRVTYGEKCIMCEQLDELKKDKDSAEEEKRVFRPRQVGLLNIIDRENLDVGVQLWECPRASVLNKIIGIVAGGGRQSNLFDDYDEAGKLLPGRDLLVTFDKKAKPQNMYFLTTDDPTVLGTAEQVAEWSKDIVELDREIFYPRITVEEQAALAGGSKEERDEVREAIRARVTPQQDETSEEEPEPEKEEAPEPESAKEEVKEPEPEKEEPKEEPKAKKTEPKKEEPKKEEPKKAADSQVDSIKDRIAKLAAKHKKADAKS